MFIGLVLLNSYVESKVQKKYVLWDMEKAPIERRTSYLLGVYDTPSLCAGFLKLPESMISLAAYMLEWIVFLTEFARNRSGTGICFGKRTKHAHNVLLQMMHDYGIFMCVVYLIMLYNSL